MILIKSSAEWGRSEGPHLFTKKHMSVCQSWGSAAVNGWPPSVQSSFHSSSKKAVCLLFCPLFGKFPLFWIKFGRSWVQSWWEFILHYLCLLNLCVVETASSLKWREHNGDLPFCLAQTCHPVWRSGPPMIITTSPNPFCLAHTQTHTSTLDKYTMGNYSGEACLSGAVTTVIARGMVGYREANRAVIVRHGRRWLILFTREGLKHGDYQTNFSYILLR